MNDITKRLLALSTVGLIPLLYPCSSAAIQINGYVNMHGTVDLNSSNLAVATGGTAFPFAAVAPTPTGAFAGTTGSAPIFAPVSWDSASTAVTPLWSFTSGGWTYSFTLTNLSFAHQDANFINITGYGILRITGTGSPYDPTPAKWAFTTTSVGPSPSLRFGFASSTSTTLDLVPRYTLRLFNFPSLESGTVAQCPYQFSYDSNSPVMLTATPSSGWIFAGWSDDASGTNNPLSVTMTTNKSITANFTNLSGCVLPSGMVSWWPGAGNGNDIVGTNNGTMENGATFASGLVGTALSLDGIDDYVALGGTAIPPPWTAELWIKRQDSPAPSSVLLADGVAALKLEQYNSSRKVGITRFGVGDYAFNYIAPAERWVHLAFVGNGASTLLYANGVWQDTLAENIALPLSQLGRDNYVDRLKGLVDELAVYNRALSAGEIQAICNAGAAGKCLAPVLITSVSRTGNNVYLSWRSQKGMTYRVQYETDLQPLTPWTDVSGDVFATGDIASKTDSNLGSSARRFYRVVMIR